MRRWRHWRTKRAGAACPVRPPACPPWASHRRAWHRPAWWAWSAARGPRCWSPGRWSRGRRSPRGHQPGRVRPGRAPWPRRWVLAPGRRRPRTVARVAEKVNRLSAVAALLGRPVGAWPTGLPVLDCAAAVVAALPPIVSPAAPGAEVTASRSVTGRGVASPPAADSDPGWAGRAAAGRGAGWSSSFHGTPPSAAAAVPVATSSPTNAVPPPAIRPGDRRDRCGPGLASKREASASEGIGAAASTRAARSVRTARSASSPGPPARSRMLWSRSDPSIPLG